MRRVCDNRSAIAPLFVRVFVSSVWSCLLARSEPNVSQLRDLRIRYDSDRSNILSEVTISLEEDGLERGLIEQFSNGTGRAQYRRSGLPDLEAEDQSAAIEDWAKSQRLFLEAKMGNRRQAAALTRIRKLPKEFEASVHGKSDLDAATKFAYLLSSTAGRAQSAIACIQVTAAHSPHAEGILEKRFGYGTSWPCEVICVPQDDTTEHPVLEAQTLVNQLVSFLTAGGCYLHKWTRNKPDAFRAVPAEKTAL
ncbi:hypothetical protein T4D_2952 [Trichinella pseudospiralis]|uniref:Uncharacterized protein n=1 Tax=Trichinella pseudospiralis TaxID=6337 RepID=A0A0V1F7I9_TRIPS|nr:hypothetical protein T4D_2952 [Trichinella pseudospiralis]